MSRDEPSRIEIRHAFERDRAALERLAALDEKPVPEGRALVALVDGEIVAALPLGGGPALADPFRWTAALVGLLELRAAQLGAKETEVRPPRAWLRARTA